MCLRVCFRYGASTVQSIVLRASIAAAAGNYAQSDEILVNEEKRLDSIGSSEDASAKIAVLYAQTLIARKRFGDALSCLEGISSLKYTPAGVSAAYYLRALQQQSESPDQCPLVILHSIAADYLVEVATALDSCPDAEYSAASGSHTLLYIAQLLEQQQQHRLSAEVYQILLRCCGDDLDASERLRVTAHLVAALSHHDPQEAERYASSMPTLETGIFDASELETKEVPRLKKQSGGNGSAGGLGEGEKDSRDRALEARRAKRRLAQRAARKASHLLKLEAEGKYDPARPSKPDAERWIPVKQRSYNKRGRKNRGKFVGGQGSGDGAQKDMLKLDAMARSQQEQPANTGKVISSSSGGGNKKKKGKGKKK